MICIWYPQMTNKYCLLFVIAIIAMVVALNCTNAQAGEVRSANNQTNVDTKYKSYTFS